MQAKKKTETELCLELRKLRRQLAEAKSREKALEQAVSQMHEDCDHCRESLKFCEEHYRLLFETAYEAIIIQDGNLFVECNKKALELFGCSERSELIGHHTSEFSPERQPDGTPSFDKAQEYIHAATQDHPQKFYWRAHRRDGKPLDLEVSLNAFMQGDKKLLQGIARDISAQRAAERKMKGMMNFWQTLIDTIPGPIFYKDRHGLFLGCNKAYEDAFRVRQEDIVGKTLHDIFPGDLADKYQEMDQQLYEKGGQQVYEWQMPSPDGTRHEMIVSKATIFNEEGIVRGLVGVITDITMRKQAEERLRESEEMFRSMAASAQDAIMAMNSKGKITFWNNAAERMFGYTADEAFGQELHLLLAPERYQRAYRNGFEHFRTTGQGPVIGKTLELAAIRKGGAEFPIELSVSAAQIRDRWNAVGIIRDISERKAAEQALRDSEQKYRDIFENALEGIFRSTPDGRLLDVNPAQARIFGYETPQALIDAFPDIAYGHYVYPEDRVKFRELCDAQGVIRNYEVQFYNKKREIIWISLNAHTVRDATGKIVCYEGFAEDITQRKRMEKELRDSERLLAEIIDFLPDATFVVDPSGRILVWNRAMEKMTDTKAEDMVGKDNYEYALVFYGERRPMLLDLLSNPDADLESLYTAFERKVDFLTAEGDRVVQGVLRSLLGKAAYLYDSEGKITGAIESLRDITERKKAERELIKREQELRIKSQSLEEVNVALKVLLKQREQDKEELENNILANIEKMIMPYIDKLKSSDLPSREASYVGIVELLLNDMTSPFANKLSAKFLKLTSKEMEIANLVKEGKSTREIAEIMHSTVRAIEFHRDNIRKKLGLKKSDRNLRSYLLSLS
ncbi:MAG: PAS domain S-box protein [Syntrophaceae bacterium]|nr:PAS domain S-box protein [Syntrophaceae bacterium]